MAGMTELQRLFAWPVAGCKYAVGKWLGYRRSRQLAAAARTPVLRREAVRELATAWDEAAANFRVSTWKRFRLQMEAGVSLGEPVYTRNTVGSGESEELRLSVEDRARVEQIRAETYIRNRNNLTRTEAYRKLYIRRPELHWALLAHMVSRNAGWNMTDLKGEWLPRLIRMERLETIFQFLERSNAYIFYDAYPQLRLYERSLTEGRSMFHLLPAFGVSRFMGPVWERFWLDRDPVPLTIALIVNEQHYIEERVVRKRYYGQNVLHTGLAEIQKLLQLNAVMFPYGGGEKLQLAGLIMESFGNLEERIEFGKKLYTLLFGVPDVFEGTLAFVKTKRHTGSRADYAPELFRAGLAAADGEAPYRDRLAGGRLRPGAERISSPVLEDAWDDIRLPLPEAGDWFKETAEVVRYFRALTMPHVFEMSWEYRLLLNKIELAVTAGERAGKLVGRGG
ncbi:DUF2515 family protein [Paenibacillus thailandensis]|uniref:DUF2515 family protein n=1 Tax=Paenibacillus thailandensis TaxID=393250 RepID=A0ABW5QX57_9BACL